MASPQRETSCGAAEAVANDVDDTRPNAPGGRTTRRRRRRRPSYLPKLACLRSDRGGAGSFDVEAAEVDGERPDPAHLVVMVNGLIGSAQNWRFAAKQFLKKYPRDVIAHCSDSNPSRLTFDGVDVMGERLAEEVISVVKLHPNLKKISFIGHSLGGLVARYAIARLYEQHPAEELCEGNHQCKSDQSGNLCPEDKLKHTIAGLEPVNFVTSASPHLGSRGHRQVPVFCGFPKLEKLATRASWMLGKTGRHLFLTDCDDGKPPLLFRMTQDTEDLKFISALQSFKRRVAYANASFDHLVGWSTSSLRHRKELPKRDCLSRHEKYPHIVNVEAAKTAGSELVDSSDNRAVAGNATELEGSAEEMLARLTRLSWERVDVSFSGSKQRFFAHSTIQVKTYLINSDGADVIQHMIDHFKL